MPAPCWPMFIQPPQPGCTGFRNQIEMTFSRLPFSLRTAGSQQSGSRGGSGNGTFMEKRRIICRHGQAGSHRISRVHGIARCR